MTMALRFRGFLVPLVPLVPSSQMISSDGGCWGSWGDGLAYQGDFRVGIVLKDYRSVMKGVRARKKGYDGVEKVGF